MSLTFMDEVGLGLRHIPDNERDLICSGNAARIYGLT
jgi:hypothetical protein